MYHNLFQNLAMRYGTLKQIFEVGR